MSFRLAVGFLLASLAMHAQAPSPAAPCTGTRSFATCEMVFELSDADAAKNPNPYATVDLAVTFRSPRQRGLTLPGYWDGGRRMVVRFSPTEAGEWAYLVNSSIGAWDGQKGLFTTAPADSPGLIHPAPTPHHWAYSEKSSTGLTQAHLWMGVSEPRFAFLDEASYRAVADARAAQKFNHLRLPIFGQSSDPAIFQAPDVPNLAFFQSLDQRVRYLNQKGIIADLVLARGPAEVLRNFNSFDRRRRFVRYVAGRYAAMNVTWQAVDQFEGEQDGRALLKEIGGALKQADPYLHPRTAGAKITSAPLLDDGWMDFAAYGSHNDSVASVEHQLYGVPAVSLNVGREDSGAGKTGPDDVDATELRHRIWNTTMSGQYPTYANTGSGPKFATSDGAKAMTVWYDVMSTTRHWELEPFFDVDNGRGLALEQIQYLIYIEKPGPIEVQVEKHSYDVLWINPANGQTVRKKFNGDHFTSEPPDRNHDWLLHIVREGTVESMNKSYKFESREESIALQVVEANTSKVPFAIETPVGDNSVSKPIPYSVKITKETRATRAMTWLWTGEASGEGQGYRVLGVSQKGEFTLPPEVTRKVPGTMHLRLYGMNANGKVYEIDTGIGLVQ